MGEPNVDPLHNAYQAVDRAIELVGAIQAPVVCSREIFRRSDRLEDWFILNSLECVSALGQQLRVAIKAMRSPVVLPAARRASCKVESPCWDGMCEASWLELGKAAAFRTYAFFGGLEVVLSSEHPERWPAVEPHRTDKQLELVQKWMLATAPVSLGHLAAEIRREFERARALGAPDWSSWSGGYRYRGRDVVLRGKQLALLDLLARSEHGESVDRIRNAVWGEESDVTDQTIRTTVCHLRLHLRETFGLGMKDPLPCTDSGLASSYRLAKEVFGSDLVD